MRGLSTFYLEPDPIKPPDPYNLGRLYVYDEKALAHLLGQHRNVLERHGWPMVPGEFVSRVATETADSKRQADLFKLIAWAFDDQRPEYRRPIPGEVSTEGRWSRLKQIASFMLKRPGS